MSDGSVDYHNQTRAMIAALQERCKTLEAAVSILQRRMDEMAESRRIEYNLNIDRELCR